MFKFAIMTSLIFSFAAISAETVKVKIEGDNLNVERVVTSYGSELVRCQRPGNSELNFLKGSLLEVPSTLTRDDCVVEILSSFTTFKIGDLIGDLTIVHEEDAPTSANVTCYRKYASENYLSCSSDGPYAAMGQDIPYVALNFKADSTLTIRLVAKPKK